MKKKLLSINEINEIDEKEPLLDEDHSQIEEEELLLDAPLVLLNKPAYPKMKLAAPLLQLNAELSFYNFITPTTFAIQKAMHSKTLGSPYIAIPIITAQGLQTLSHTALFAAQINDWRSVIDLSEKITKRGFPFLLNVLSTSTSFRFLLEALLSKKSPTTQAVTIPLASAGAALLLYIVVPAILKSSCLRKWQIAGLLGSNYVRYSGPISGILSLLKLQEDTIFPFMKQVSRWEKNLIPVGFGVLGVISALCQISKLKRLHQISDNIFEPLPIMSKDALESLFFWFQCLALIVIDTKNGRIPTTTFTIITSITASLGLFKIGYNVINYFLNGRDEKQQERLAFYPKAPIVELSDVTVEDFIMIPESIEEEIIASDEELDELDDFDSSDAIYSKIYEGSAAIPFFKNTAQVVKSIRPFVPEACTIF